MPLEKLYRGERRGRHDKILRQRRGWCDADKGRAWRREDGLACGDDCGRRKITGA
jgi:hypothetical protein